MRARRQRARAIRLRVDLHAAEVDVRLAVLVDVAAIGARRAHEPLPSGLGVVNEMSVRGAMMIRSTIGRRLDVRLRAQDLLRIPALLRDVSARRRWRVGQTTRARRHAAMREDAAANTVVLVITTPAG